jgi:uncharacterized protein (DUF433 family)
MTQLVIEAQPVPLRQEDTGAIRVGQTRVHLETVLEAYLEGATAEAIVESFDTLRLADVYAVISYYLNHADKVNDYLRQREELAAELRRKIEAAQPARPGFREELLARRARMEEERTSPGN